MLEFREGPFELSGAVRVIRELVAHVNKFIREFNASFSLPIVWGRITGTPTTRAGYGITDAAALNHRHNASEIDGLPVSGGGSGGTPPIRFADLLEKPSTVDGYGLTDASRVGHTHPWSDVHSRPSTRAGYGITDAAALVHTHDDRYYTEAEVDSLVGIQRREIPVGAIDGVNAIFTTADNYQTGRIEVYLNGLLQMAGAGNDYTESGANTITFVSAPLAGDAIFTIYSASV